MESLLTSVKVQSHDTRGLFSRVILGLIRQINAYFLNQEGSLLVFSPDQLNQVSLSYQTLFKKKLSFPKRTAACMGHVNSHTQRPDKDSATQTHDTETQIEQTVTPTLFQKRGLSPRDTWKLATLLVAARYGELRMTQVILSRGAPVNGFLSKSLVNSLHLACKGGHANVVDLLLKHGAHIDEYTSNRCTPLVIGCLQGHLPVVEMLLRQGANPNAKNLNQNTALISACLQEYPEIAELLLVHGARIDDINCMGLTPLLISCAVGNMRLVQMLVQRGADIEKKSLQGRTPLLTAYMNEHYGVAKALIDYGADVNAHTQDSTYPLHVVCDKGRIEDIKMLLEKGAQVDQQTNRGLRPLDFVCLNGRADIAELLLDNGALVNTNIAGCHNALTLACKFGHAETVRLLVIRGAFVDVNWPTEYIGRESTPVEARQSIAMNLLWAGMKAPPVHKLPAGWPPGLSVVFQVFPMVTLAQLLHMTINESRVRVRAPGIRDWMKSDPIRFLMVVRALIQHRVPWNVQMVILKKTTQPHWSSA